LLLVQVSGILEGASSSTSFPHIHNPATGAWTRVTPPAGFPAVSSLTPTDLNSSGQVVGSFRSGGTRGFIWTPDPSLPDGGSSELFHLNPQSATSTPAIPWRVSDSGHLLYHLASDLTKAAADPARRPLALFSHDEWSPPVFTDVNDYGEFVGVVYDPFSDSMRTFLATAEGFLFLSAPGFSDLAGVADFAWLYPPDVDLDQIQWVELQWNWNPDTWLAEPVWPPDGYAPPLGWDAYPPDTYAMGHALDRDGRQVHFCRTWGQGIL
jgi:hypothetical protein